MNMEIALNVAGKLSQVGQAWDGVKQTASTAVDSIKSFANGDIGGGLGQAGSAVFKGADTYSRVAYGLQSGGGSPWMLPQQT